MILRNEVLQGCCLELMQTLPDHSVDMILCDLPYGTTRCSWDSAIPFDDLWAAYRRVVKPNGAIVLFSAQPFTSALVMSNPKMFKYEIIWRKTTPTGYLNAKKQVMRSHENILVFYSKQPTFNPQKTYGHARKVSTAAHKRNSRKAEVYGEYRPATYDSTERYPTSVLTFSRDSQKSALHPTQKPVELCEWLIKTFTNPGELVLDNCAGSGSTGIACMRAGRDYILMEKEQKYVEVINRRITGEVFKDIF